MKTRIISVTKLVLQVFGGISLIVIIGIATYIAYNMWLDNRDKTNLATNDDVRFVLNWCELGDSRIEKVVQSHVSARSFTGDHVDAYAIKISHVDISELTKNTDEIRGGWYRGDQLPPVVDAAVSFAGQWPSSVPWFPTANEIKSSEFYVYVWSVYYHGIRLTSAEVIIVRPSDKMVFYFGGKT